MPEDLLREAVHWLVLVVETAGAVVIGVGAVLAFGMFVVALIRRDLRGFVRVRLRLGRFLALGLEFLLAADILETAVAPTFEEIGKLAAVAAIRTALNYFLAKEIAAERQELGADGETPEHLPP
ncbi:DUF1622 domain-containing protein [Georgenia sp. MJ206]|uniref:DUF1622 domain-containing protein n=1 Tax=Georgenia wangjunii TaxID=3117730 RepID=UPI002F26BD6F